MYNKQIYLLDKILGKLDDYIPSRDHKYFLAGGALTSVFSGAAINDLDLFFNSQEDFDFTYKALADKTLELSSESDSKEEYAKIVSSFETNNAISYHFKKEKLKVQLIKKVFGSPKDILDNFDFSICMAAYIPQTQEFVLHPDFLYDLADRKLVYNINGKFPVASLWRVQKYLKKGFNFSAIENIKLALNINNLNIKNYRDLREQLEGIDTLFLKDFTDVLLREEGNDYQLKEVMDLLNRILEEKLGLNDEND